MTVEGEMREQETELAVRGMVLKQKGDLALTLVGCGRLTVASIDVFLNLLGCWRRTADVYEGVVSRLRGGMQNSTDPGGRRAVGVPDAQPDVLALLAGESGESGPKAG